MPVTTAWKHFQALWESLTPPVPEYVYISFYKINASGQRLPGAVFYLFAYNGPGSPPLTLLNPEILADQNQPWTRVAYATSSNTAMVFSMKVDRYYQLVEISPPYGYQLPMGQWRIRAIYGPPVGLSITPVGDMPMPEIIGIGPPGTYTIINWPAFSLPLTGGRGGIGNIALVGAVIFVAAHGVLGYKFFKKAKNS